MYPKSSKSKDVSQGLPGYYKAKIDMQEFVKERLIQGVNRDTLHLQIAEKYGFGKKPVNDYIKLLEKQGLIKVSSVKGEEVLRLA